MADKPTPTDAELEALLLDKLPASKHYIRPVIEKMVAAMQAAIDKWGQPAQAAEPVAWWIPKAEQFCIADKSGDRPFAKAWEPLYTTPQPTQTQPVAREPLTPERVKEIVLGAGYDQCGIPDTERAAFINGLRHGEQAHGIKGGQLHSHNPVTS